MTTLERNYTGDNGKGPAVMEERNGNGTVGALVAGNLVSDVKNVDEETLVTNA